MYLSRYRLQDFQVSLKIKTTGFSGISQDINFGIFRYLSRHKLQEVIVHPHLPRYADDSEVKWKVS
jgi:hypothetical protein